MGAISREGFMVLRRHFRTVNKCRQIDFDRHSQRALAIWERRSKLRWCVDWGPFAEAVAEAKAARAAWRGPERGPRTKIKPIGPTSNPAKPLI
jgi:hypothetical protein